MKIEWVTHDVLDDVVRVGREFHAESRYGSSFPLDEDRLRQTLGAALDDDRGIYFLALARDDDDEPAGWLFGTIERPYFTHALLARDFGFYIRPGYRGTDAGQRLLTAFRRWSEKRGAAEVHLYHTVDIDPRRFDRFVRRAGFEFTGGNYALVLNPA